MAPDVKALDRLQSQLLTSGLQERNNALFQVISQLIGFVRQGIDLNTARTGGGSGGGSSSTVNNYNNQFLLPYDGVDGQDGMTIVGPKGDPGIMGPPGMDAIGGDGGIESLIVPPYNSYPISGSPIQYMYGNGIWQSPLAQNSFPGNPVGTASLTDVMMGLAIAWTPRQTGRAIIIATMNAGNTTLANGVTATLYGGTGAAPANGAAVTGSQLSGSKTFTVPVANGNTELVLITFANGLIGTLQTYWIDIAIRAVTGGTASISSISVHFLEI